jgi:hypothetical protein
MSTKHPGALSKRLHDRCSGLFPSKVVNRMVVQTVGGTALTLFR